MPDPRVEAFLAAEQQAVTLVAQLEALKKEVGSYREAKDALNGTAMALEGAAARVSELAGKAGEVLDSIRAIGTPELLSGIGRVDKRVSEGIQTLGRGIQASQGTVVEAIDTANQRMLAKLGTVLTVTMVCGVVILIGLAALLVMSAK